MQNAQISHLVVRAAPAEMEEVILGFVPLMPGAVMTRCAEADKARFTRPNDYPEFAPLEATHDASVTLLKVTCIGPREQRAVFLVRSDSFAEREVVARSLFRCLGTRWWLSVPCILNGEPQADLATGVGGAYRTAELRRSEQRKLFEQLRREIDNDLRGTGLTYDKLQCQL